MELIIGIVHQIHLEHRLQASLVKGRVVSHQWQSLNLWLNLSPYLWKYPGVHGILHGKSMHPSIPIGIILRLWLDETLVAIHNLTIPYYHNAYGANAGSLLVGSLKIYRCKILHECKVTNYRCIIQIFNIYISILVCPFPWQFLSCAWFHEICHPKKQQDVLP